MGVGFRMTRNWLCTSQKSFGEAIECGASGFDGLRDSVRDRSDNKINSSLVPDWYRIFYVMYRVPVRIIKSSYNRKIDRPFRNDLKNTESQYYCVCVCVCLCSSVLYVCLSAPLFLSAVVLSKAIFVKISCLDKQPQFIESGCQTEDMISRLNEYDRLDTRVGMEWIKTTHFPRSLYQFLCHSCMMVFSLI